MLRSPRPRARLSTEDVLADTLVQIIIPGRVDHGSADRGKVAVAVN